MTRGLSWRVCVAAAVVVALCGSARADVDPAAKAVLEGSAAAIKGAEHLRYEVLNKGEGAFGALTPINTASVFVERAAGAAGTKWRIEGKQESAMQKEATQFLAVSDGARVTQVDQRTKTVTERLAAQAGGEVLTIARSAWLGDLASETPYAKALSASSVKLLESAEVGGVKVDVVEVIEADKNKSRWMIGKDDKLPRKYIEFYQGFTDADATVWIVTNVKTGEAAPAGTFAISVPEGFTLSKAEDAIPKAVPEAPATPAAPGAAPGTAPGATPGVTPAPATPAAPRERAVGFNVGDIAPEFELSKADGDKLKLSSLRGKTVVVDFWGTWCLPCKKAAPELQKIHEARKGQPFDLLAVAVRERSDEAPISYMKEKGYTYTLLLRGDDVAKQYGIKAYPTYVVVNAQGVITARIESIEDLTNRLNTAVDAAMKGDEKSAAK
jgi:thiol-disulfide isomerase/thioredoxin/outer membrane lipoprotein-sorting protein